MTRAERTKLRDQRIKAAYEKLKAVKEHGVSKHSYQWMISELADKWCLSTFTIEKIIDKTK